MTSEPPDRPTEIRRNHKRDVRKVGWKGLHPTVKRFHGVYPDGVRVPAKEMKQVEARLQRSTTLPDYDITITPKRTESQGK